MLIKQNVSEYIAIGDAVIIDGGLPLKPGEEEKTESGMVIGKSVGEVTQWGRVIAVGDDVKYVTVGDIVALPLNTGGSLTFVPKLGDIINGKNNYDKNSNSIVATQEKFIRVSYKQIDGV